MNNAKEVVEILEGIFELRSRIKELEELLLLIREDLRMRSEDGVVDISDFIWMRMDKALDKQEVSDE